MNQAIGELKVAVDKTAVQAMSVLRGEKTGIAAATAIIDGVIDQNLVLVEYWRVLLRDVQRLAGALADRQPVRPVEVKRSQVNITP